MLTCRISVYNVNVTGNRMVERLKMGSPEPRKRSKRKGIEVVYGNM
jgi:hypothetical protein